MAAEALLEMKQISKKFAGNTVLDHVDFTLRRGEVVALLGENGAGKSTLIKILGGIHTADQGEILIHGKKARIGNVREAARQGVSIIHQELMLMQHMTIAENIFMGRELGRGLFSDAKEQRKRAQELLDSFQMGFSADTVLSDLNIAQQQMVEIIKAVSFQSSIIAMDEPTSSLSDTEAELLFDLIDKLKKEGIGIIIVSHRLNDIFRCADRVTVLRDGVNVGTKAIEETNNDDLVSMMVGRELSNYYIANQAKAGEEILRVEHLSDKRRVKDVSFSVRRGEILGLAGLVGAGRSETLNCIFGLRAKKEGTVIYEGKEVCFSNVGAAMRAGIGLVPEDRKLQGLFLKQSVRFNLTFNVLDRFLARFWYQKHRESDIVENYVEKMQIKIRNDEQAASQLSGGNQQKVLIGKWLSSANQLLLLDEPTRGVDVKTKSDIYHLIGKLTEQGMGIVFVSSELPELINICDRIVVLSDGRTTGELCKEEFNQQKVMKLATQAFAAQ